MSRWFRHYAGMCRDDKLVRVALRSKQPIERVVWVWAAILESASEVNDNGRYDFDIGEASYFLRCDETDVGSICSALEGLGRICETHVSKWSDRQFSSDTSAERQKRYRDKQKVRDDGNSDGEITSPLRDGDGPEKETELELETDIRDPDGSLADADASAEGSLRMGGAEKRRAEELSKLHLLGSDWNSLASSYGLAQIAEIKPSSARERAALARIREGSDMAAAFTKIRGSPFLLGKTSDFRVSFDWITNPTNLAKVLEGNYDEVRKPPVHRPIYASAQR